MYNNSLLSHRQRCSGMILLSAPRSVNLRSVNNSGLRKKALKVTNQIFIKKCKKDKRYSAKIVHGDDKYTIKSLSEKLKVSTATVSNAVRDCKSVTINGVDYIIEIEHFRVDVYRYGFITDENMLVKDAAMIMGCSKTYLSQIKDKNKITVNGYSVKSYGGES